jgi:large subunit ribosomal protein L23
MHIYEVLRRPIMTEKSMIQAENRKYTFEIDRRANKKQVKEAVEKAFDVKVEKVAIISVPGKTRRWGRKVVQTQSWKKAVVTLAPGNSIQLFEGV